MAYQELKEQLEKLLSEDINNRSSIQEMRRNVFLSSETSSRHREELEKKEGSIKELTSLIDAKKSLNSNLQSKINSLQDELTDERTAHQSTVENFEEKISRLKAENELLKSRLDEKTAENSGIQTLMLQNEDYAGKIRELIYHIDELNTKAELQKQEFNGASNDNAKLNQQISELNNSNTNLQNAAIANTEMVSGLEDKLTLQENQIESLRLLLEASKNENANLTSNLSLIDEYEVAINNWKADKEMVDSDNANLIAQSELLTYENGNLLFELNEIKNELATLNTQLLESESKYNALRNGMEQERLELNTELERVKGEMNGFDKEAEFKVSTLTDELRLIVNEFENYKSISKEQIIELKGKFEVMEFEKNELLMKLENLSQEILNSNKTESTTTNQESEEFIARLFKQIDGLNEEKQNLSERAELASQEITALKTELNVLSQLIDNQNNTPSRLEESNNPSKLAEAVLFSNEEKTAMNTKITELVREIDRCLALLNV